MTPLSHLSRQLWVGLAPLCWLLGLALTHELTYSAGALRAPLERLMLSLPPSFGAGLGESAYPAVLSLMGLSLGALTVGLLLALCHLCTPPLIQRPLSAEPARLKEWGAGLLLLIGGVILGSELNNILQGPLQPETVSSATEAQLSAWRAALLTPWGLSYELLLLPFIEVSLFHLLTQRSLPLQSSSARVWLTALIMTSLSWRLSTSAFMINLAAAMLFEHTRSRQLTFGLYFDFQLLSLLIAQGVGPQIEGFDLLTAPWQPLWFDLVGAVLFAGGAWLLYKQPSFDERRAMRLWRELCLSELQGELQGELMSAQDQEDQEDQDHQENQGDDP